MYKANDNAFTSNLQSITGSHQGAVWCLLLGPPDWRQDVSTDLFACVSWVLLLGLRHVCLSALLA